MGGVRPPRDWLQRQKKILIMRMILINALLVCLMVGINYLYVKDLIK